MSTSRAVSTSGQLAPEASALLKRLDYILHIKWDLPLSVISTSPDTFDCKSPQSFAKFVLTRTVCSGSASTDTAVCGQVVKYLSRAEWAFLPRRDRLPSEVDRGRLLRFALFLSDL